MNTLEKRHTRLSTSLNLTKLGSLSSSHPFTQQIDIVFPTGCLELENVLCALQTRYAKGKVDLAKVLSASPRFVHQYVPSPQEQSMMSSNHYQHASEILALGDWVNAVQNDDVWCIDTRGILTLCVCKETYERLGLVGQKLSFKHQSGGRFVIPLQLHENAESAPVQKRRRNALESWDTDFTLNVTDPSTKIKIEGGPSSLARPDVKGVWEVVYCSTEPVNDNSTRSLDQWASQAGILDPVISIVTCEKTHLENVWVPNPTSLPPRRQAKQEEEYEDWEHEVSVLFEWVGMAGFHAQRLQVNDRVDPFVALYEPPTSSRVGNVTHLRWRGLLSPGFVQSVIDASAAFLQSSRAPPDSFVAITAHGVTNSPVVYLPPRGPEKSSSKSTAAPLNPPAHLPKKDGEDTWCLVLAPDEERKDVKNVLYESVGQWDARWG